MGGEGPNPPDAESLDRLAEDWIALWQSELAALAADREMAEGWAAMAAAWAAMAGAWTRAAATPGLFRPPGGHAADDASGPSRPAPPPRASAARAAPDDGDRTRDSSDAGEFRIRLAELERRLADLEGGAGGGSADPPRPRRRRPRA